MKFKFDIKKYILVILGVLFIASDIYIGNNIFISSFEQCFFGLFKIEGTSTAPFIVAIFWILLLFIILCPIFLLPVYDLGKKKIISIKEKNIQLYPLKYIKTYGIILIIIGVLILSDIIGLFSFVGNTIFSSTEIFDDYYVDGDDVNISFPDEKRNLIYIFVESLESSNISKSNGGFFEESIIPNLEQMALDNVNFSNNEKIGGAIPIDGAAWTAAAMIAHTSGIPMKITFNDFDVNSTRFMNVTSISDILSYNGYNNYLLLGSDSSFGGRKAYFSNHNYLIWDYYTAIEEGKIADDYFEWWGYEDSKLFEYAKEKLTLIASKNEPFNFTMLTADTHFTDGYLDKSCDSGVFDNAYSNSFYCSDAMIYEFVEWIKEQDFYENTTIVIVGDHLTMQDGFYDSSYEDKRVIFNTFINANINTEYNSKNRVFTVLDMYPTTLASLGVNIEGDRLGLGTNLFSDIPTIPELMGIDIFNKELLKYSDYYYNYIRSNNVVK